MINRLQFYKEKDYGSGLFLMSAVEVAQAKSAEISSWINTLIGKEVKVPDDLQSGVIFVEVLNKLKPETIKKFIAEPKNLFQKGENFKRVFNTVFFFIDFFF
jgi:hypothetical protein